MEDVEQTTAKLEEPEDPATPSEEEKPQAKFSQDDLDRIAGKTREEERRKYERQKEEAQRQAREKALQEQEDYKKLAEERAQTVSERETRISELEAVETERDTLAGRIEALETRLKGILKPKLEQVPELFREFVEAKSPEEQAEWFEKNAEKLETSSAAEERPRGSRATGRAASSGGADTEQAKQAREAHRSVSRI